MARPKQSIEERLLAARVAIQNALDDKSLQSSLAVFGYNQEKLEVGKALLEKAQSAQQTQQSEYGDQYDATDKVNRIWERANKVYMRNVKIARIALRDWRGALSKLDLHGQRKRAIAGWIIQARQFYSGLLADAEMMAKMAEFNITEEKLKAGQEQVNGVEAAHLIQGKEKGEAQIATQARDAAMDELAQWMSDFITIARMALEEEPQALEKMGIVEPS